MNITDSLPKLETIEIWSVWTDPAIEPFPRVEKLEIDEVRDRGLELLLVSDIADFGDLFFTGLVDRVTEIWLGWYRIRPWNFTLTWCFDEKVWKSTFSTKTTDKSSLRLTHFRK